MSSALRPAGSTRQWRIIRAHVLERDGGRCWICGELGATTVDHVIPRHHGGTDHPANLRAAHATCNYRRGARTRYAERVITSRQW
jgi:5-methylcytosine-specific restriction endonuclease McrA